MANINFKSTDLIGGIFGIGAIAWGLYQNWKAKKVSDKLELAIDELSAKDKIEIENSMIERAIERAANREVKSIISDCARKIQNDAHDDIHREVKKEVEAQYKTISGGVVDRIQEEVLLINRDAIVQKIVDKATPDVERDAKLQISRVVKAQTDALAVQTNTFESFAGALKAGFGKALSNNGPHITIG